MQQMSLALLLAPPSLRLTRPRTCLHDAGFPGISDIRAVRAAIGTMPGTWLLTGARWLLAFPNSDR